MSHILSKMTICENTNFLTFSCVIRCFLVVCLVTNLVEVQASALLFAGANNKFFPPQPYYNHDDGYYHYYGPSSAAAPKLAINTNLSVRSGSIKENPEATEQLTNEILQENSNAVDKTKQKRFVFSSFGWGAGGLPGAYGSRHGNYNINAVSAKGKRFVFSSFGWGAAGVPRIEDFQTKAAAAAAAAVSDEAPETQNNKFRHQQQHEQLATAASDPNLYRWLHSNNNNKPISQRSTHNSEMLMTQTLPSENGPTQNDKDQRRIRSSSFVKQKKHNKYSSAAAQTLIALVRLLSAQNNNNNNSTHQTHRWTSQLQSPPYSQSAAVVSSPPASSLSSDNNNMLPHAAYELAL